MSKKKKPQTAEGEAFVKDLDRRMNGNGDELADFNKSDFLVNLAKLADHHGKLAKHHQQSADFWLGSAMGTVTCPLTTSFFYVGAHIEKLLGTEAAWGCVIVFIASWVLTLIGMGIRQGRHLAYGIGAGLFTVAIICVLVASYLIFWMDEHWFIGMFYVLVLFTAWLFGLKFIVKKVIFKKPEEKDATE